MLVCGGGITSPSLFSLFQNGGVLIKICNSNNFPHRITIWCDHQTVRVRNQKTGLVVVVVVVAVNYCPMVSSLSWVNSLWRWTKKGQKEWQRGGINTSLLQQTTTITNLLLSIGSGRSLKRKLLDLVLDVDNDGGVSVEMMTSSCVVHVVAGGGGCGVLERPPCCW